MVMLTVRMVETAEESQDWSGCDGDLLHTELSYYPSGLLRRGVYISTPSLVGYIALTLFWECSFGKGPSITLWMR